MQNLKQKEENKEKKAKSSYKKPSDRAILEAFEKTRNLSAIADGCGVAPSTVYRWLEKDKALKAKLDKIKDRIDEIDLDRYESTAKVLAQGVPKYETEIKDGKEIKHMAGWIEYPNVTMLIFLLKTKGKKRGYIEKSEVDWKGEVAPLVINFPGAKTGGNNGGDERRSIDLGALQINMPKKDA